MVMSNNVRDKIHQMLCSVRDRAPDIVTRMGRLTVESPISEYLKLRHDWLGFQCNAYVPHYLGFDAERTACHNILEKVRNSPEHNNYRTIVDTLGPISIKSRLIA